MKRLQRVAMTWVACAGAVSLGVACAPAASITPAAPAATALAGFPPLIPVNHFFDNPEITGARISPDGAWLSYLKPYRGKLNIHVRRIGDTTERVMTADTIRPVLNYFWAADGSQILYAQDKGGNENYHVYSVPLTGAGIPEARNLTPFDDVRAQIVAVPVDLPERILIAMNRRDPALFDAFWLDIRTGELTLVSENPGRHAGYLLDKQHRLRVALATNAAGGTEIHTRASDTAPWRTIASYPASEQVIPLRVHPDGRRMYASSNHGDTDLARLVFIDMETGAETRIETDPENQVDFSGAYFSDLTDELIATWYNADTVRIYPKNERFARDLERIRALHEGQPNITSSTRDENVFTIAFDSPVDPGVTYLYDRTTGRGEFLFRPRPWLNADHLAFMTPVSFPARDGLTLHGYLSTPRGATARNLPMVLLVHGGPWARDSWGYQPEVQLLTNRGYAVLQVNYRGSTGFGKHFFNAAVGEWAEKMHTDLIDGVEWAVREGTADPARIGVYGGSYGGYATLISLTRTAETFACGVSYVGPSSLVTLIESFPAYWRPFLEGTWYRHVGDPSIPEQREDLLARSPITMVDRIVDPLLIVQGANDPRVTKLESDQLAIALRDRGVPVRYMLAENEGHGFINPDNRIALYHAMQLFFADCLGGRAQQGIEAPIQRRIDQMMVDVDTLRLAPVAAAGGAAVAAVAISFSGTLMPATLTYSQKIELPGGTMEASTTQSISSTTIDGTPAWLVVESAQSPMGAASDSVYLDRATLLPLRRVARQGPATIELTFAPGSVRGAIQAGPQRLPIDARVQGSALVTGAPLNAALGTLTLTEAYAATLETFDVLAARVVPQTIRVTGSETVTVPAGSFESWKLDLTPNDGSQQPSVIWIEKAAPHRVVRSITRLPAQAGGGTVTAELTSP